MSSSIPEMPFLNSVTLLPSDRMTLGRRLPKINSETKRDDHQLGQAQVGQKEGKGIMDRFLASK